MGGHPDEQPGENHAENLQPAHHVSGKSVNCFSVDLEPGSGF